MLLRFVVSGSSSLSSQLFLEALGCSRRVLGLILRLYLRCIRSPPRTQRSSSLFLDGRGARSFNADERRLLQGRGRMLIPGRESAHGSKAPARENVGLVALRRLTCVVRQIAGHMRSHAKARCDLHGRRHARPLRRSDNDLTLEQPLSRRGGVPGTPTTSNKSGQIDPPRLTLRAELGSCRPRKYLTSRFDRSSGRTGGCRSRAKGGRA